MSQEQWFDEPVHGSIDLARPPGFSEEECVGPYRDKEEYVPIPFVFASIKLAQHILDSTAGPEFQKTAGWKRVKKDGYKVTVEDTRESSPYKQEELLRRVVISVVFRWAKDGTILPFTRIMCRSIDMKTEVPVTIVTLVSALNGVALYRREHRNACTPGVTAEESARVDDNPNLKRALEELNRIWKWFDRLLEGKGEGVEG